MIIKEGYGSKSLTIKFSRSNTSNRKAEVWITMAHPDGSRGQTETLSYATLEELLDLQDELKKVIAELVK